ncbi:MAG: hypothetical protein U0271_30710 [Polyangiaceae bacterium]
MDLAAIEEELLEVDLAFERARSSTELKALLQRLARLRDLVDKSELSVDARRSLNASIALREPIFEARRVSALGRELREADPRAFEALVREGRLVEERFLRHFEGRRATDLLDLALLRELVAILTELVSRLGELGGRELDAALEVMTKLERDAALVQRRAHPAARDGFFGLLANLQFKAFDEGVADVSPSCVRVELVRRIISELERIHGEMRAFEPSSAPNTGNLAIVAGRLVTYKEVLEDARSVQNALGARARVAAFGPWLDRLERALAREQAKNPALLETSATSPLIDKLDEARRELRALAAPELEARAANLQNAAIALHATLVRVQTKSPPDLEIPGADTRKVELSRGAILTRAEGLLALGYRDADATLASMPSVELQPGGPPEPAALPPGRRSMPSELVELDSVIACFANAGRRPELSHFANGSLFRWVTASSYRGALATNALRSSPKPVHLFVRLAGSGPYIYLGPVAVVGHRQPAKASTIQADFALESPIDLDTWGRFGGAARIVNFDFKEYVYPSDKLRSLDSHLANWVKRDKLHLELSGYEPTVLRMHVAPGTRWLDLQSSNSSVPITLEPSASGVTANTPAGVLCDCGARTLSTSRHIFTRDEALEVLRTFAQSGQLPDKVVARPDPPAAPETTRETAELEVARGLMRKVRRNLERITHRLGQIGYAFAATVPLRYLEPDELAALDALERLGPVPASLRAFYEVVGTVNLLQSFKQLDQRLDAHALPETIRLLGHLDPLTIPPPTKLVAAMARFAPGGHPRTIAFFMEDCLKADFSGDYVYIELPCAEPDFSLLLGDEPFERFTDYVKRAVAWGGFRGHRCGDPNEARKDVAGFVAPPASVIANLILGLEPM